MGKSEKTQREGKNAKKAGARASARPPFDLDDPVLPKWIEEKALASGGYPYDDELKKKLYKKELRRLQIELLRLQAHVQKTGMRIVILLEGRDTAGKGGTVKAFMQHLNPRHAHAVALPRPTDAEQGQWYFQRYIVHLPTKGDILLFDRSWYNRAGVERVMGFCTAEQLADFLRDAPEFEDLLVKDGILLFKFFLTVGRETQLLRFHERRHDPLKQWKMTDIDLAAMSKWDEYTEARDDMFRFTHTATAPWTVIRSNDQRRARIEAIRTVLSSIDYAGKNDDVVGTPDPKIVGSGPEFFFSE